MLPPGVPDLPPLARGCALAHVVRQIAAPEHPLTPGAGAPCRAFGGGADGNARRARFTPHDGGWLVTAEPGRRPPKLHLAAGARVVFNRVWEIESRVEATVRRLGEAGSGRRATGRERLAGVAFRRW